MDLLLDLFAFFSFSEPNTLYVTLGVILICSASSVVGIFIFLQKKSLLGDAISHSLLPGICIGFMISGVKDPFILIISAIISGWISIYAIEYIIKNTKLKEDTAVGLVLSVFFGFGILLLTHIQHSGNANQSGLDHFIFGSAASIVKKDLYALIGIALLLYLVVILFFKELKLYTFDRDFANVSGFPTKLIEFILNTLTVLAIVVGVQAMGVVLMASILIAPAATARFWTHDLKKMMVIASFLSSIAGITGVFISYTQTAMPTGPWIVVVISIFALLSFFFAPTKGLVAILYSRYQFQNKITDENILKCLYQLGEFDQSFEKPRSIEEMNNRRGFDQKVLRKGLSRLVNQGFLLKQKDIKDYYILSKIGMKLGAKTVKLHRLWELYLTQYLNIATDHVHDDAESIEHILTPALEKELLLKLGHPVVDPHNKPIPDPSKL